MKITVIGASAGVGLETTRLLLERGNQVTTLSRSTVPLEDHPGLTRLHGSSTHRADVIAALIGAEAVLVTLGTGNSTRPTTLYSDSARVLLEALTHCGHTIPVLVLTGFGAGDSRDYNSPLMKLLFRLLLKAVYADKTVMEQMISSGYPNHELVRPGRLTHGPQTGNYRVLDRLTRGMKVGAISRKDVAHYLVNEAEKPAHLGQAVALTY
jgi:putative NADH-flavin reductase